MEIKNLILTCFMFAYAQSGVFGATNIPGNYDWRQSDLGIDADTPPLQIYVEDSKGRITGANPSRPIDTFGTQDNERGGLAQIPLSSVAQDNNGDDENNGQPDSHTFWQMDIFDAEKQNFIIHLKGIVSGATTVTVGAIFPKGSNPSFVNSNFPVFVQPNEAKEVEVSFDPLARTIGVQGMVKNDDLLNDVESACQLNLITSGRACKHLTELANQIQDALEHGQPGVAKDLILNFLFSLGDSRPLNCREEDDHRFVKEPALTILKEDAKALLLRIKDMRG